MYFLVGRNFHYSFTKILESSWVNWRWPQQISVCLSALTSQLSFTSWHQLHWPLGQARRFITSLLPIPECCARPAVFLFPLLKSQGTNGQFPVNRALKTLTAQRSVDRKHSQEEFVPHASVENLQFKKDCQAIFFIWLFRSLKNPVRTAFLHHLLCVPVLMVTSAWWLHGSGFNPC